MRMRLCLGGMIEQRMAMKCSTCQQDIGGPIRDGVMNVEANLFGAERYVVCPTCKQVVLEHLQTPAYKSVWTRKNRAKKR